MTDKKKKTSHSPDNRNEFLRAWIFGTWKVWIIGLIVAFVVMIGIFLLMEGDVVSDPLGLGIILYVLILPATASMGWIQQNALKNHLNIGISNWWWLTALMWSVGIFLAVNISNALFSDVAVRPMWGSSLFFMIVLSVPGVAQALLLRQHLSQAWLYGLASVVSGIISGALLQEDNGQFWMASPAVSAVISAIALLWLTSPVTARLSTGKEKSKS